MAKRSWVIFLCFGIIGWSLPVRAADLAREGTPARKLQRGFLNVALSPLEISHELAKEKKVESFVPSWVAGFGRGSLFAVGRALAGVYEILTFPIPLPSNYGSLVSPEFAWQHLEPKESESRSGPHGR